MIYCQFIDMHCTLELLFNDLLSLLGIYSLLINCTLSLSHAPFLVVFEGIVVLTQMSKATAKSHCKCLCINWTFWWCLYSAENFHFHHFKQKMLFSVQPCFGSSSTFMLVILIIRIRFFKSVALLFTVAYDKFCKTQCITLHNDVSVICKSKYHVPLLHFFFSLHCSDKTANA